MIAPTELTQNYERINTPYDPNQPIETLFQKIQDARAFAVAGGQPYGNAMVVNVDYTLVLNKDCSPMHVERGNQELLPARHGPNSRLISQQHIVNSG
jgi:hypothetical protein